MITARQRQRRQVGWIELDKSTSPHCWKARYNDWSQVRTNKDGRTRPAQRKVVLGYKIKDDLPTKSAAEKKWEEIRKSLLEPESNSSPGTYSFKSFVDQIFVPERNAARPWRARSSEKFLYLMSKAYPVFGHRPLKDIGTGELQRFLNELAQTKCHDTVAGMLTYIRAIFSEAVELEYITKSPCRRLVLPATREPRRPHVDAEQIRRLDAGLSGRDRTILRLFTRCGLRAGEVFGLQWGDILAERAILIRRTFSKGRLGPPKTKGSAQKIAMPETLFTELMELRDQDPNWTPDSWVFPASRTRGAQRMPASADNWLKRTLKPLADRLGFTINLHMFRRGFATIAHHNGGVLKDIQEQLRHASIVTTANLYVQPLPESVRAVVENIDLNLRIPVQCKETEG